MSCFAVVHFQTGQINFIPEWLLVTLQAKQIGIIEDYDCTNAKFILDEVLLVFDVGLA